MVKKARIVLFLVLVVGLLGRSPVWAQSVISTHSGLIYFFEGAAFIGDEQLEQKFGRFAYLAAGRQLRTERGRAEVLLTPDIILRVDENSAIRMLSDKISNTRVELLSGSAILKSNGSSGIVSRLIYKNWELAGSRGCTYRIDSEPPRLRVYEGGVELAMAGRCESITVREHEAFPLAGESATSVEEDGFWSWAMGRSETISRENAIGAAIKDEPKQPDTANVVLSGFNSSGVTGLTGDPGCENGATWRLSCGAELGPFMLAIVYRLPPRFAKYKRYILRIRARRRPNRLPAMWR